MVGHRIIILSMSGACEYYPNQSKQSKVIEEQKDKKIDVLRLAGIAVVVVFVGWMQLLQPVWISNIVIVITVIVGGYPIYRESFYALKKGRVNMELSMVIAIIASLILQQYLPAIAITFFALLSEFIEGFIVQRGRMNIKALYNLAPKKAVVKNKNPGNLRREETKEIPISEVNIGDIVIVREGDLIPLDGHIVKGASTVDQSSITGESIPLDKDIGDTVFAGTINLTHLIEVKCEKLSTDTTFAKIIHLIEEAEVSKAPIQKLSDTLATRLIQFAIGLSVLTFIITQNIVSTLSVIVVAGACGLAVGTPIALLAANSKLSKKGIIVKGGLQIENLKHAGTIVFDKTGTLTSGKTIVSQVVSLHEGISAKKVLEYAALAERNINHPLAKAIEEKTIENKIQINSDARNDSNNQPPINSSDNNLVKVGMGVTIVQNGRQIRVGNLKFIEEELSLIDKKYLSSNSNSKFSLLLNSKGYQCLVSNNKQNPGYDETLQFTEYNNNNSGNIHDLLFGSSTAAFVSLDEKIIGAILFEDKLRSETKEAIFKIKAMKINTMMLTGDNEKIARRIANETGIDKYYANLLPQDKVSKIEEIVKSQEKGKTVVMVGDGINDAPALAKAHVGIAMGKTGTDVAIETADVVLMTEDLTKIPYLLRVSRQAFSTIQQNFFGTLFIDGLGFILAFAGVLNPLVAAVIHVSSELIFMANSSRNLLDG